MKRFEISEELDFEDDALAKDLKLTIYRIIQELLNNTVKFAQASFVKVAIIEANSKLRVLIQDNGVGYDVTSKKNGLGLANIKSRVELFLEKVKIESAPGKGCRTVAVFPI